MQGHFAESKVAARGPGDLQEPVKAAPPICRRFEAAERGSLVSIQPLLSGMNTRATDAGTIRVGMIVPFAEHLVFLHNRVDDSQPRNISKSVDQGVNEH